MPICQFSAEFSLFKVDICFEKAQKAITLHQNLLESHFLVGVRRVMKYLLYQIFARYFFSICWCVVSDSSTPSLKHAIFITDGHVCVVGA